MARPKIGHFYLLFLYLPIGFLVLESLILFVWTHLLAPQIFKPPRTIINPLPNFLSPQRSFAFNLWLPDERNIFPTDLPPPKLTAESYLAIDLSSGRFLLQKDIRKRMPVASLVKIMTALVALERGDLEEKIVVSKEAAQIGEDSMGVSEGEKLTLEELLWGLLLPSGNDAAEAIAQGLAGRREVFINWMNSKAREIGLKDTYFINPSGLDEEQKQYSTAYDLMVITFWALKYPKFREIVKTPYHFIPYSKEHKAFHLFTQVNLLRENPEVVGVKMGYTPKAGLCGVSLVKKEGREILGVVLNSKNRREDLKKLLNYSLETLNFSPSID